MYKKQDVLFASYWQFQAMPDNVFYKKSFLSVFQEDNVLLFMFKQKCVLNIIMLAISSTQ